MLVLEYMEGGDLYQAIQENSYPLDTGLLSWYQKGSTIALDIAKGLVFLHQREVSLTYDPCRLPHWLLGSWPMLHRLHASVCASILCAPFGIIALKLAHISTQYRHTSSGI